MRYTLRDADQRFRAWVHRYGMVTVFISALLPIPVLAASRSSPPAPAPWE